ncbi:hypothetical protein Tco_0798255 [Tanacetum coccineum]
MFKAKKNLEKVKEHLMAEEIKELVEGSDNVEENVKVTSSPLRNDNNQIDPNTRLEPKSDKESLEEKRKHVEEIRNTPSPTIFKSPRIQSNLVYLDTEELQELTVTDQQPSYSTPSSSLPKSKLSVTTRLLSFMPRRKFDELAQDLQDIMLGSLPKLVDEHIMKILQTQVPSHVVQGFILETKKSQADVAKMIADGIQLIHRYFVIRPRDQDDHDDDAYPEGENSAKRQKTSEHGIFVSGESSYDDVLPNEKVSQELVDEISQTVDEAKLRKVKGNSGREKIVLSLHKFPVVSFPIDEIEERTFRWVDKCVNRFNPYARYETYGELGHEHKFITEIVARRANGSIESITESYYKNLNKNDIEDMYFLIINHKVDDYAETGLLWSLSVFIRSTVIWERVHDFQLGVESYQQQVNLIGPTITFPGIEKYKVFFIVSEPIYGIIYKNNKKEKRVMKHQEVHKFCDATLKRVLEGLKSYNNDVKHGYVIPSRNHEDAKYL